MNDIQSGIQYFIEGFHLILQPGLRRFVVIPFIINVICFIILFSMAYHYWGLFNIWMLYSLPVWLHWLSAFGWLLFLMSFFIIFIFTFTTFAHLITAPFNSFLAEKVEQRLTGQVSNRSSLLENLIDIPRMLGRQFSLLAYYLPRAIFLLILFFIPLIQLIAVPLWFLFHAWFLTLTYIDYPTDNHRIPIKEVKRWLRQKRMLAFSFGMLVLFGMMLPMVNLLIISAAVAGATRLWVKESSHTMNIQ